MNFCPIEEAKSFQRTKITIIYSPLNVPRLFSSICKSVSYLPDGATLILSFHLICSQISGTSHTQVCAGLWVLCEYLITSQVWGVPLRVDMRWRTAASYCQTLRGVYQRYSGTNLLACCNAIQCVRPYMWPQGWNWRLLDWLSLTFLVILAQNKMCLLSAIYLKFTNISKICVKCSKKSRKL